jgi:molybdopterin molybdotransferase
MPEGADAVVMVEDSERVGDDGVRLSRSVPAGAPSGAPATTCGSATPVRARDRRHAGGRRRARQRQRRSVTVWPRARVAVLSTGDELDRRRLAAGGRRDPREQQDDAGRAARRGGL